MVAYDFQNDVRRPSWVAGRVSLGQVGSGRLVTEIKTSKLITGSIYIYAMHVKPLLTLNDSFSPPLSAMFSPCVFFPSICNVKRGNSASSHTPSRHPSLEGPIQS